MKNPSDYINDEILELKGSRTKIRLILWELMKQARTIKKLNKNFKNGNNGRTRIRIRQ